MADNDDYFPELDAPSENKGATALATKPDKTDDYFPELDKPKTKAPEEGWVSKASKGILEGAKAFASALPNALSPIEQGVNLSQYGYNHIPFGLGNLSPLTSDWSPVTNLANQAAGAPPNPSGYSDLLGQYNRTPQGWLGGQTPRQMANAHPFASAAGELIGGLPFALASGGAGEAAELGNLARIGKAVLTGAGYGAGFGGLQEAGEEAKNNDQLDAGKIAQAALGNAAFGGALGLGAGLAGRIFAKPPAPEEPKLLPYDKVIEPPVRDTSGVTVRQGVWPVKEPPKLLPYDKPSVIAPPGPQERLKQRGEELFAEQPRMAEEQVVSPLKTKVTKTVKAELAKPEAPDSSWRQARDEAARILKPEEARPLRPLAQAKTDLDRAAARLEGALKEADRDLQTRFSDKHYISPDNYKKLLAFQKEHGAKITKLTEPYVESTLAENDQFTPAYKFQTDDPAEEIKKLTNEFLLARAKYQIQRAKAAKHLPLNETVQVAVKDADGEIRAVNIRLRQQAASRSIKFPTQELQDAYKHLRESLKETDSTQFWDNFDRFIKEQLPHANEIVQKAFADLPKNGQAKLVLGAGLAAWSALNQHQEAQAAPTPSPRLVGNILKGVKKSGWNDLQSFRPIQRIAATEVTTDIITKGFDAASRTFAQKRLDYLRQLDRVSLKAAEQLQKDYAKALEAERQRVEKLGAKPHGLSIAGMARYARMLEYDHGDLLGEPSEESGPFNVFWRYLTGGGTQSIFYGNFRAATLHVLEAWVAFGSRYPKATAQAIAGMVSSPVYREYALYHSPKGMFQQILERQKSLPGVKQLNEAIDKAIKSLPGGEVLSDAASAQIFERGKLGFGATVVAEHNARNYPGGPKQYMQDWLANAKNNSPVPAVRETQFARVEMDNFVDMNKGIMYMPEKSPLQERTVFQRHGAFFGSMFPFLRAVAQQTRFFAGLIDDGINAVARRDPEALAHAIKGVILGHIIVASVAGSHVLPDYIWSVLEGIDEKGADLLRDALDETQSKIAGGNQIQDFGIKYLPYLQAHGLFLGESADQILRGLNPKEPKQLRQAIVSMVGLSLVSRIGPQGTMNLGYLWERLIRGMRGYEQYAKYYDNSLMDKLMGRPYPLKLVNKKLPYDIPQALMHWLLKMENPSEVAANKLAEQRGAKQFQKDMHKIGHNWQKVSKQLAEGIF